MGLDMPMATRKPRGRAVQGASRSQSAREPLHYPRLVDSPPSEPSSRRRPCRHPRRLGEGGATVMPESPGARSTGWSLVAPTPPSLPPLAHGATAHAAVPETLRHTGVAATSLSLPSLLRIANEGDATAPAAAPLDQPRRHPPRQEPTYAGAATAHRSRLRSY